MNLVQRGYSRDRQIIEMVEQCGVLSADQIAVMLFGDLRTGQRKCQQRLKRLADAKHLHRGRMAVHLSYIYSIDRPPAQAAHRLELNWALIWLMRGLQSWERMVSWEYEPDYGFVRPDLLFVAENTVTKQYRCVYVELDRSPRNRWDKTSKYNRLYAEEAYRGSWWVERASKFPGVLVVTVQESRARAIRSSVQVENEHGLRFDVRLLDNLRREVWPWVSSG